MEIFYVENIPDLHIDWEVTRGKTSVREDFSQATATVWAFLTGNGGMKPLSVDVVDNKLYADIPKDILEVGTYGLKIIWVKDGNNIQTREQLLACNKRCMSEVFDLFGISASPYAETNPNGDITFHIKSSAATYGYDGLSAYERAVMLGMTTLSEREWTASIGVYVRGKGINSAQQAGTGSTALGDNSHAEGVGTEAGCEEEYTYYEEDPETGEIIERTEIEIVGHATHAEGSYTKAHANRAHAEGDHTKALASNAHAEGNYTEARGKDSHAEGDSTMAIGSQSHSEGKNTTALGKQSHAEGRLCSASGETSHAEGEGCEAIANGSHAGGSGSVANAVASVAQGVFARTSNASEAAFGRYNVSNTGSQKSECTLFSVGNGKNADERSNAIEIRQDGSLYIWIDGEFVKLQNYLASLQTLIESAGITVEETAADGNGEEEPEAIEELFPDNDNYYYNGSIGTFRGFPIQ